MIKDKQSPEWRAVKEYCRARLAEMREQNDGPLDHADTNGLRGQIAFAKEILALEHTEPKADVRSESYLD